MAARRNPKQIADEAWDWHYEAKKAYNKIRSEYLKPNGTATSEMYSAALAAVAQTAQTALLAEEIIQKHKEQAR